MITLNDDGAPGTSGRELDNVWHVDKPTYAKKEIKTQ